MRKLIIEGDKEIKFDINSSREFDVAKWRKEYGFTQEELASILDVHRRNIQEMEASGKCLLKYSAKLVRLENNAEYALKFFKEHKNIDASTLFNKAYEIKNYKQIVECTYLIEQFNGIDEYNLFTKFNLENLKGLLLKIVQSHSMGLTKIMKIIFNYDIEYYKKYGHTFTGSKYLKMENGPVVHGLYELKAMMTYEGMIETISEYDYDNDSEKILIKGKDKEITIDIDMDIFNDVIKRKKEEMIEESHKLKVYNDTQNFKWLKLADEFH